MRTVFLDLDGTLIDSTLRHVVLLDNLLKKNNIDVLKNNEFLECKRNGLSTKSYLKQVIGLDENLADHISKEWVLHIEDEEYLKYDVLYDDAIAFLEEMSQIKHDLIAITARKHENSVMKFVSEMGVGLYLKELVIVSPNNAAKAKTDIIDSLKGADSIVVGDTEVDYKAAVSNGIGYYMLNRGFRSAEFWKRMGVVSYSNLIEILNKERN